MTTQNSIVTFYQASITYRLSFSFMYNKSMYSECVTLGVQIQLHVMLKKIEKSIQERLLHPEEAVVMVMPEFIRFCNMSLFHNVLIMVPTQVIVYDNMQN